MNTKEKNSMKDESLKERFLAAIMMEREQIMVELQAVLDKHKDGDVSFMFNNDIETPVVACCFTKDEASFQRYLEK